MGAKCNRAKNSVNILDYAPLLSQAITATTTSPVHTNDEHDVANSIYPFVSFHPTVDSHITNHCTIKSHPFLAPPGAL